MRANFGGFDDLSSSHGQDDDNSLSPRSPERLPMNTVLQCVMPVVGLQRLTVPLQPTEPTAAVVEPPRHGVNRHGSTVSQLTHPRELISTVSRTIQKTHTTLRRSRLIHIFYILR